MAESSEALDARHELGRRVRARRHKLGLSQEALAERSGHHPTYVASIERGQRNITVETLLRLAEALEIDPSQLVKGLLPDGPGVLREVPLKPPGSLPRGTRLTRRDRTSGR